MLKRLLIFVFTFAAALGGGTALIVMRAAKAVTPKTAADSAAVAVKTDSAAAHDSAHSADSTIAKKDTTPVARAAAMPARDSAIAAVAPAAAPARDSVKSVAVLPMGVAPRAAAPAIAPASALLAGGRLSKIFTAMAPRDAAKVLEQMDDADVKEILGRLNEKKAAEILALIPAQRAAVISKAALVNPGTNK